MKLIDKDALVAEINRQIELLKPFLGSCAGQIVAEANAKLSILEWLKSFLNTLEVKEEDLENVAAAEWDEYLRKINGEPDPAYLLLHKDDYIELAKHFFGLGLSVNNPITAADRGTAEEVIINLKRVEKDYRISLAKEIEWLKNKVKKRE